MLYNHDETICYEDLGLVGDVWRSKLIVDGKEYISDVDAAEMNLQRAQVRFRFLMDEAHFKGFGFDIAKIFDVR